MLNFPRNQFLIQNNNLNFQGINNINLQNNLNNDDNSNKSNSTDDFQGYFGRRINILFYTHKGTKFQMTPPENIKISELLSKFMKKINLDENLIDDKIFFLFNGYRLNKNDVRNLSEIGISNLSTILVIDSANIIGG